MSCISKQTLPEGTNFLAPALLRYSVCKQCRKDAYKDVTHEGKKVNGWNDYAEAWWTPCLTTTLFSIGEVILRAGYICCPPKVFLDMQKEIITLIDKNFSGDKRKLLRGSAGCTSQQKLYVTESVPDWCPCKVLHEAIQIRSMTIFGAAIFNKVIRYVIVCHNCNHEWYVEEKLPESTSSAGGVFVTTSISSKAKVVCKECKQGDDITILKRQFFYG